VQGEEDKEHRYTKISLTPRLDTLPVFVRGGSIIPKQPLVQSTSKTPDGPLELHIYPGENCAGEIYEDDGHSMGFARGEFLRQAVSCTASSVTFAAREGSFKPWWHEMVIIIHGVGAETRKTIPDMPEGGTVTIDAR
jgi:alpha-glucosidase